MSRKQSLGCFILGVDHCNISVSANMESESVTLRLLCNVI